MLVMICDDDINIANYIKSLIEKNYDENIKVNTYNTVDKLEHSIFNKEIPNAIIMDICVEKSNGIDALKKFVNIYREHLLFLLQVIPNIVRIFLLISIPLVCSPNR